MKMHTKGMSAALFISMTINAGASSYVTSWVGNTYGGGTTRNFVAQDVKEARVTRDGQFICGTWWDEGHREVAVYSKSGIRDLPTRTSTLAVATDQVNLYHAVKGQIVKYKLSSFELVKSVTASSSYIVGMDCHKNKVFVTYPPNKPSGQSIWIDGLKGNPVDGNFQSGEFMVAPIGWSNVRLDSSCNAWAGQTRYNCKGLDANGIPQYQVSDVTTFSIPASDFVKVKGFEYVERESRLYVHGYTAQYPDSLNMASKPTAGRVMIRYDNWPEAPKRGATFVMPYTKIEYDMIRSISVAGDYVFGAIYGVWGRGTEVHVFNKMTGVRDTLMTPGPEVGKQSGMQDITPCILAFKRPSSKEYLVFVEEDWYAKVLLFRFRPSSVQTGLSIDRGLVHKEDFPAGSFNLIGRRFQGFSIRGGIHGYKSVTNTTGLHLSKKTARYRLLPR